MAKQPNKARTALLIIDMINDLDFPQAASLRRQAMPAARAIARLKARFKQRGVPAIYVNNNFGLWRADWKEVYAKCVSEKSPGKALAEILRPEPDDYFLLKPKHSGFFSSPLEILLEELGCRHLVITGVAANICVYFTVHDAHTRGYEITVPKDCVAANTSRATATALRQMQEVFGVKPVASASIKRIA